jgi:hypothetical protein
LGADNACLGAAVPWNPTIAKYTAKKAAKVGELPDTHVANNCIVTVANIQMKCDMVEGAGKSHEWLLTVGGQDSLGPTSSYHQPVITLINGPSASNFKTNGGQAIELKGINFGPYPDGALVTYGPQGTEYTPTNIEVVDHEVSSYFIFL